MRRLGIFSTLSALVFNPFFALADIIIPPIDKAGETTTTTLSNHLAPIDPHAAYGDAIDPMQYAEQAADRTRELFITSLVFTVLIEFCVVYYLARKVFKVEATFGRLLAAGTIPSVMTLSIVYLLNLTQYASLYLGFATLEGAIIATETFIIGAILKTPIKTSFIISLAANLVSALFGLYGLPVLGI